ncbi:MAG TPA: YwiC-like family protein [Pyrinomonadaceae bacterium]|nr:YwiC-like family protein [Pyrinomonadaceae bacterium]
MQATASSIKQKSGIPVKSIALPIEHGSWGFVFEPIAAGLLLAPSLAAIFITLFVVGAFLARQPLKFVLADWQQGRRLPRTAIALRFVFIFGGVATAGLFGSILSAPPTSFVPFVVTAPFVVYLVLQDAARQSRNFLPEILAAFALSSSLPAIALAVGWSWPASLALWAIMVARLVPSIIYVRNRLRLEKGKQFSRVSPIVSHILALIIVGALAYAGLSPLLLLPVMFVLLGRSVVGMSSFRAVARAKVIGIYEVVYGIITVLALVFGFYVGF